mmetsp:Transcript_13930/g.26107  ORF Transcript_13930/g.26107 Transcript_13930/m.26107 type:complete len:366 (-) Transcript_13930:698-1795(-)
MIGVCFKNVEVKEYFPSVSLSTFNESVTFKFSEFAFDLDRYIAQEREKQVAQVQTVSVPASSLHQIVHYYLAYYGYAETLREFDVAAKLDKLNVFPPENSRARKVSLKLAETLSLIEQPGKCGICLNDSDASTCRDCVRHLIGTVETGKTRLPLQSPSLSRRGSCLSDDNNLKRADSVDLSSVYMKEFAIDFPADDEPVTDYFEESAKVVRRGEVRRLLMNGEIITALEYIQRVFPQVTSSKAMFSVYVQHFIELIRKQEISEALTYAREALAPIRNYKVLCRKEADIPVPISEIVGLMCYKSPTECVLSYLLSQTQRELTADVINAAILESEGSQMSCSLNKLLQQYLTTLQTLRFSGQITLDL